MYVTSVYVCDDPLPHICLQYVLLVCWLQPGYISSNLKDEFCVHNNVKSNFFKLRMCEMDGQIMIFIIQFQDKFFPINIVLWNTQEELGQMYGLNLK